MFLLNTIVFILQELLNQVRQGVGVENSIFARVAKLRNFTAKVIFTEFSHYEISQAILVGKAIFGGHFARVAKFSQPYCLVFLHLLFPRPVNLCSPDSQPLLFMPSNFQNEKEKKTRQP